MIPDAIVPVVAWSAVVLWVGVAIVERSDLLHPERLPDSVREAAILAVYSAAIGGAVSSLGFIDWIPQDTSTMVAAAWRAALLVAGIYAFIGSAMDVRARRRSARTK